MSAGRDRGLWAMLAWVVFPALPVVLENAYSGLLSFNMNGFADPHDWNWPIWLTELGPLIGFGYLAGATLVLPDEPTGHRWPRAWLSRRWFWVGVGPWTGFLVWVAVVWVASFVKQQLADDAFGWVPRIMRAWEGTWAATIAGWLAVAFLVTTFCYGWMAFALAAFRRARRLDKTGESVRRGLTVAAGFVGSLFGSFWAVTEWWRGFFFDPRIVPALLAAVTLAAVCGCGGPVTYGEVRRRDLFHAMLLAWTVGLALIWRWWARPRSKPPG